jgi:myb proto-oncogene protein
LDPSIDRTNERTGKWTAVEDSKLKDAVQAHGENNWPEVAALVPGRMRIQCYNRWRDALDPSIVRAIGHTGKWTADQDIKLKDAVLTHGGKNWGAIAALNPGRTKKLCNTRWHDNLDPSIDRAYERTGKWTADEDIKLKDAKLTHGGKDWAVIAALVPGRTKRQCSNRWKKSIDPNRSTVR